MELPRCKSCLTDFDAKSHRPQVLPKCGHTMCFSCITSSIRRSSKLVCPEDFTSYDNPQIGDFPANNAILLMIEKSPKVCETHGKPKEFFCTSDNAEICAECGLFGQHRSHEIVPFKELQKTNERSLKSLRDAVEQYSSLAEAKEGFLAQKVKEAMRRARKSLVNGYKKLKARVKEYVFSEFEKLEKVILDKFSVSSGELSCEQARQKLVYLNKSVSDLTVENSSEFRVAPKIASLLVQLKAMFKESAEHFSALRSYFDIFSNFSMEMKVDYEKLCKGIIVDTEAMKRIAQGKLEESQLLLQTFTDINNHDLFVDSCGSSPTESAQKSSGKMKTDFETSIKRTADAAANRPLLKQRSGSEKNLKAASDTRGRDSVAEPSFKKTAGVFRQNPQRDDRVYQSIINSPFLSSKTKNVITLREAENTNFLNSHFPSEKKKGAVSPLLEYSKKCKSNQQSPNLNTLKTGPYYNLRVDKNTSMDNSFNARKRLSATATGTRAVGLTSNKKVQGGGEKESNLQVANLKNITVTKDKLTRFLVNVNEAKTQLSKVVFEKVIFDCDPIAMVAEAFSVPRPSPILFDFRASNVFLTPMESHRAVLSHLSNLNIKILI